MVPELPHCRSLLFVPAHVLRFVEKAGACGADAVVLDLEDSVPEEQKSAARSGLATAAAMLTQKNIAVYVRINHVAAHAAADIEAAAGTNVCGLMLPKVDTAAQVAVISALTAKHESARGLPVGHARFLVQVESVHALPNLDDIAGSPRVAAINLGVDDFCVSSGALPSIESLLVPTQMLLFAARRAGIVPLGFAGSVSDYADLDGFRKIVRHARGLGFRGATCIHPNQVGILNQEFAPGEEEIAEARAILEAYEKGLTEGRGAAGYRGRMIDAPVVTRARETLMRK